MGPYPFIKGVIPGFWQGNFPFAERDKQRFHPIRTEMKFLLDRLQGGVYTNCINHSDTVSTDDTDRAAETIPFAGR